LAVKTRIIRIPPDTVVSDSNEEIAAILRRDGVLAFPTDTFYGLGVNAFSAAAVGKIYEIKKREQGKPLSVVVADFEAAKSVAADPPGVFRILADEFWPGPLTLIVRAKPLFPAGMLGPGRTVAVRVPALTWLRKFLAECGFPLTATSANLSGGGEIDSAEVVRRAFDGLVDLIIDGGRTPGGAPSTIVDLTGPAPSVLRQGAIPSERLRRAWDGSASR
jgi:L-threonylcarbamoyladenylate synthase